MGGGFGETIHLLFRIECGGEERSKLEGGLAGVNERKTQNLLQLRGG